MRRTKLGNKMVKKVITLAMALMLSASTAMSGMATLTVYAEETIAESLNNSDTKTTTVNEDGSVTTVETITDTTENTDDSVTTTETTTETTVTTGENIDYTENGNVTVSDQMNDGGTEYYVDGIQVADEAAAQAEGQQDYIVKEQVIDEDATQINHYIVDADGNYVLDENNEKIAVEDGTTIQQIEVVEKADQSIEAIDEEKIVYVKENEEGVKELVDAQTEGAAEYVEVENGEEYAQTVTINELTITDAEGNEVKQFVDDDLAKLLDDDDTTTSENYSLETVYTVTVKDADGNEQQIEVKDSELQDGDKLEVNEEDGSVKVSVEEKKTYSFTGKDGQTYSANGEKLEIEEVEEGYYVWLLGKKVFIKTGTSYYATSSDGNKVEVKKNTKTTESISYETTLGGTTYAVDSQNVKTEIHYEVYDKQGQKVMELTKEQYESRNVDSKDYAKVDDQYVVYDAAGNKTATFTEDEWKVITEGEVTYKEITKMYYSTDANYIEKTFGENENELKLGDTYYKLVVKLFENTDGITYGTPACVIDEAAEEAVITVPYTLKDGTEGTLTRRIALKDFGLSNSATVEIKYVPTYTTKTGYEFTVDVIKDTTESVVTIKTETSKEVTTTTQTNTDAGATADNPIKANNGEAINEAGSNNYKAEHIDVRFNVNISDELKELGVTKAKVESAEVIIDRNEKYVASTVRQESFGVYEFNFSKEKVDNKKAGQHNGNNGGGNSGFQGNQTLTILAKISYELNGETKVLWYATTLYPDVNSDLNVCRGFGSSLGFDYEVSLEEINAAIEQQITTSTTTTTISKEDSVKMEIGIETSLTEDETKEIIDAGVDEGSQKITQNSESPSVAPTATPGAAPTATPGTAPTPVTPVVVIADTPVPMADAPVVDDEPVVEVPVVEEAAVLGATRTEESAAVLGARRGSEQAVLGKRRRPETGDSAALSIWMSIMAMSTGMAGVSGIKIVRNKKKDEGNN